jgi:hypothetical protein
VVRLKVMHRNGRAEYAYVSVGHQLGFELLRSGIALSTSVNESARA